MKANQMNKIQNRSFKRKPLAALIVLALASQFSANVAQANGSYGSNTDAAGTAIAVPTFYANSPQGIQPAFDPVKLTYPAGVTVDTGAPLRKFVDALGGAYNGLDGLKGDVGLKSGIPVAITEKWFNPITKTQTSDDYYEIAIVEYTERLHSDLAKETRLRGYVQIETPAIAAGLKDITTLIGSEHIAATYPDGTAIKDAAGNPVFFVHQPHYLGPVILASKGTAVRIKATNYLPYTDATGKSVGSRNGTGGELFIPVDETISGGGPVLDGNGQPVMARDAKGKLVLDAAGQPMPIKMAQNRAAIHWHGGDTPWISDGTPHQWFTPAGDISYTIGDALHPVKDALHPNGVGMGKGDSAVNVPDMPNPGDGSYTLYFPNNLSGRLMMYHDHTSGLTKVNVYVGEAAGYVVYDPVELKLVSDALGTPLDATPLTGPFAGSTLPSGLLDAVGIPLVIQDKTFVPNNMGAAAKASDNVTPQSQDAKWDLNHWGQPGDFFFPHVYETNQDPNSIDGTNPVGRWDWGPWFWPVFPAQMSLPSGDYGHVTATPEAFMDTALVNGQAYPTLTVDPKTYRFRILSVANDRTQNLGLYQAVDAAGVVCDANNANPTVAPAMPGGVAPVACTEVRMVAALPNASFPANWPTDGRPGGVPDPATAGPDIVQIGNEGGLLPAPAIWKSQPVTYEQNVRSITVFNILNHDLLLAAAERADVLIDFTKYAGQTLIVYNDAPAPMPGFDPRIDYYTGDGDNSGAGGAFNTPEGYGPNTRTVMQIKVNATNTSQLGGPLDTAALAQALPAAYAATQPAPNIPQVVYNSPFGTNSVNNYATIGTGSNATNGVYTYTDDLGNKQTIPVINKAIQELFDPIYGRMNATLAVELPFSSATVATTIPLAYVDTPVERLDAIADGETQIWKITHNGVDSHPVHFHLVNVQVLNRVGWDGTIKPPEANEVGWKETLRMNPLEDVYVAVKAVHPVVPFGVPKSSRLLDPAQSQGSTLGFTQIDATTGQAPTTQTYIGANGVSAAQAATLYANQLTEFDNEYVWHCHILGHEEQDFMRPFIFHPHVVVPDAPAAVTRVDSTTLSWLDTTPYGGQDAEGVPTAGTNAAYPMPTSSPKNEVGFKVVQNVHVTTKVPAYQTSSVTTVRRTNAAGVVLSNIAQPAVKVDVAATTRLNTTTGTVGLTPANVTTWQGNMPASGPNANVFVASATANTVTTTRAAGITTRTTVALTTPAHTNATTTAYDYAVVAYNAAGDSPQGTLATVTTAGALNGKGVVAAIVSKPAPTLVAAAGPTGLTQVLNADGSVTLNWTAVAGATGYVVSGNGSTQTVTGTSFTSTAAAGATAFTVAAQSLSGTTAAAATQVYAGKAFDPIAFAAGNAGTGTLTLNWANDPRNVNNVTGLALSWTPDGALAPVTQLLAPASTGATFVNLTPGASYSFQLVANSNLINGSSAPVPMTAVAAP